MAAEVTLTGIECPLVGIEIENMWATNCRCTALTPKHLQHDSYSVIHPDAGNHVMVKVLRHGEETGNFLCEECNISLGFDEDGVVVKSGIDAEGSVHYE